jgi:hypothetical protein
MKNFRFILSAFAFFCLTLSSNSQSVCYSFDDCVIDATDNNTLAATRNHAFNTFGNGNSGCLEDWEVTSGTPSIYRNVDGLGNAYNGTQYALIGICGDFAPSEYSDGVALKYNFDAGQTYTVSMAVKTQITTNPVDVNFLLLQNPLGYTYNSNIGCSATPGVPGSAVSVHNLQSYSSGTWQTISFTVTNLNSNYTRLWIRGIRTQSGSNSLMVDSVCVTHQLINSVGDNLSDTFTELTCIPNPITSTAAIHYKANSTLTKLLITDIAGHIVKQVDIQHLYSGALSITTGDMPRGMYLCSLISEGKLLKTIKIVRE